MGPRVRLPAIATAVLLVVASLGGDRAVAIETRGELFLQSETRRLHQEQLSNLEQLDDVLFQGALQFQHETERFKLELRPELRAVYSEGVSAAATDPARIRVDSPERLVNLDWELRFGSRFQALLSLERASVSLLSETGEITVGRRPISLGVLRVFPLWNKFSRNLPIAIGNPWVFSSDAIELRNQAGPVALRAFALSGPTVANDGVALGEATWFGEELEVHALGGWWWKSGAAGLAIVKDWAGMTWKEEALLLFGDLQTELQNGVEVEYAFNDSLSALVEWIYLSAGYARDGYSLSAPSRFSSLRGVQYGLLQATYKLTPLWTLTLGGLANLLDPSAYAIGGVTHSLSQNIELAVEAKAPLGATGSEFSQETVRLPGGASLGAPAQASLSLRYSF